MATKLDRLLEKIDPSRTLDKISAEVDRAVNSFPMEKVTIDDWDEYEAYLADFCQHIERETLRIGPDVPKNREVYWARCIKIFEKEFGSKWRPNVFEMVKTGKAGGLYRVLKIIADNMAKTYAQNTILVDVADYFESLTVDEQMAAADEYLEKYGHLLPSEFTGGRGIRLKAQFRKIIEEHPKIIQRMRRIAR